MSEQFSDDVPVWYESEQSEVGLFAVQALTSISAIAAMPEGGRRRWLVSDHQAFGDTLEFEAWIRKRGLPADAPNEVRIDLSDDLAAWHVALPFSEAERNVLVTAYGQQWVRAGSISLPEAMRDELKAKEVIDSGVKNVVQGRDLMRRWWAWRREADEFAGQGSLDEAKTALMRFAGRLVAPERMPDFYYDLQGIERPVPYQDY